MTSVTFHVGMPKCATTTIQSFLTERADWLGDRGFAYDKHPDDPTENQGNAAQLAEFAMNGTRQQVVDHLRFFLRAEGNVLLSSEMLFGLGRGNGFATIMEEVQRQGRDLRVIVYLKRQDLWIESDFKQHVKDGNLWVGEFAELLEMRKSKRTLDYHFTLTNWALQVGHERLNVVTLNPSQPEGYALDNFLALLGLRRPDGAVRAPRLNVSPAASVTEAARQIKKSLIAAGVSQDEICHLIGQFLSAARDESPSGAGDSFLSPDARRSLMAHLTEANAALSRSFLGGKPAFDELAADGAGGWVAPEGRAPAVLAGMVARSLLQDRAAQDSDGAQRESNASFLGKFKSLLGH